MLVSYNEISGCMKGGKFYDKLNYCWLIVRPLLHGTGSPATRFQKE
jgi:hypothetical protein